MKKYILASLLALGLTGCNEHIPPGHVGIIITPNGMHKDILPAGLHSCWGRDRMTLIELAEETTTEELSILCADDLNFSFDLKVRSKLRSSDGEAITDLLTIQGKNVKSLNGTVSVLQRDFLYETYVMPQARSIARDVVSKYETTQIRENREVIQAEIQKRLVTALDGTPMVVTMVATSNFDYPEVITKAVEKRRAREIAIQEEKAKQAMAMLQATNRQKIAEKMKTVRVAEAEAESAYNKITGESLTNSYLELRAIEAQLEAQKAFFDTIGPNDKVVVVPGPSEGSADSPVMLNMPTQKTVAK